MAIAHVVVLSVAFAILLILPMLVAHLLRPGDRRDATGTNAAGAILRATLTRPGGETVLVRRDNGRGVVSLDEAFAEDEAHRRAAPPDDEVNADPEREGRRHGPA